MKAIGGSCPLIFSGLNKKSYKYFCYIYINIMPLLCLVPWFMSSYAFQHLEGVVHLLIGLACIVNW